MRFCCEQHPALHVARGSSEIVFKNGIADVEDEDDIAILQQLADMGVRADNSDSVTTTPIVTTRKPLPYGVLWYSPTFGVADGYGASAEQLILALDSQVPITVETGHEIAGETHIAGVLKRPRVLSDVYVAYSLPNRGAWRARIHGQAIVGFTMLEHAQIPDDWEASMREIDVLATCSHFCVTLFKKFFSERDIATPIAYVPLGVNADLYPFKRRSYQRGNDKFTVLHSSTRMDEERKGAREAYRAFCEAFGDRQDVRLILRAKYGHVDVNGDPRVEFRTGQIADAQKYNVLREAHVFLHPSFGEGFGLAPLEALASGLPTICADNTGMRDYADLVYPIRCSADDKWQRPDHDEMVRILRLVESDYRSAAAMAAQSAKTVRETWNYRRSADALANAIALARETRNRKVNT